MHTVAGLAAQSLLPRPGGGGVCESGDQDGFAMILQAKLAKAHEPFAKP